MEKAVLFDMDGVLLETEALKARAHEQTIASFGGSSPRDFYSSVMGRSHHEVIAALMAVSGIAVLADTYTQTYKEYYINMLYNQITMTAGSRELLVHLKERGYKLALVTSSLHWMVDYIMETLYLRPCFDAIVCADDIAREKPAPDAYQEALMLLQLPATEAVVVEDSEAGVIAGVTAGCKVIAVRHPYNQCHDFSLASRILTSLTPLIEVVGIVDHLLLS
jgi:HAD superfamily hydrolase (TIGR01509 family)